MIAIAVKLWGKRVGGLAWDPIRKSALFEYDTDYMSNGFSISPIQMPFQKGVYQFQELSDSKTFQGLPGAIADSLPEKFGNKILNQYLSKQGKTIFDLNPIEKLCYVGKRGMGALEYEPDIDLFLTQKNTPIKIDELVEVANQVLKDKKIKKATLNQLETLIKIGTSAGGAKAKVVIGIHRKTGEVVSGDADLADDYDHWILKFDSIENEELATSSEIGLIEYCYSKLAYEAGIRMMECKLLQDENRNHFMTKRFDRITLSKKIHTVTFAGLTHFDRDPPGNVGYENLFQTIRNMGLNQDRLNEMYRRMVFNIIFRNQDDHAKNHAFLMFGDGSWDLSPAYDLCFSFKPGNAFIETHQMSCNGKRDNFKREDLLSAARMADVKKPNEIIGEVLHVASLWKKISAQNGLSKKARDFIYSCFRLKI